MKLGSAAAAMGLYGVTTVLAQVTSLITVPRGTLLMSQRHSLAGPRTSRLIATLRPEEREARRAAKNLQTGAPSDAFAQTAGRAQPDGTLSAELPSHHQQVPPSFPNWTEDSWSNISGVL